MDRLGKVLCGKTADLPTSGSTAITTPRCYFYGPQDPSTPSIHPHCHLLMAEMASLCTNQPHQSGTAANTSDYDCSSNASDATQTCASCAGVETAQPPAPHQSFAASQETSPSLPAGHILALGSTNMLEGSTGCHVWPPGLWLAQWLLNHPEIVRGRRCVELGAGTGLVGIACAQLGASQVCSDTASLPVTATNRTTRPCPMCVPPSNAHICSDTPTGHRRPAQRRHAAFDPCPLLRHLCSAFVTWYIQCVTFNSISMVRAG